jgi:hypothetical protein
MAPTSIFIFIEEGDGGQACHFTSRRVTVALWTISRQERFLTLVDRGNKVIAFHPQHIKQDLMISF